jgi:hypothetical protein
MKTQTLDIVSLEALLEREPGPAHHDGSPAEPEHPLARELRTVLAFPDAHRVGDLARVVEHILREMSMIEAGMLPAGA